MENAAELLSWLGETWTKGLAETLETMTGEQSRAGWQPGPAAAEAGDALWWEQPFNLGPGVAVWAGAPEAAWLELGSYTLRSAGIEAGDPADAKNTYLEIVSQGLNALARAIGAKLSTRVSCESGREQAPPSEALHGFAVELSAGTQTWQGLSFRCSQALLDIFETGVVHASDVDMAAPAEPGPPLLEQAEEDKVIAAAPPKTIDLLMEVEMPVSVSFGRAQLPLKDVLKLTTGSIVELNRAISEPVEVIVNSCVIARGEVVVIEGNYGVRIQEIISREKRLRTLG